MEDLYRLALACQPGVGPVIARQLLAHCRSAEAVYKSSVRALTAIPEVGPGTARSIVKKPSLEQAENELEIVRRNGIRMLFFLDKDYPSRLRHFNTSPVLLFYRGNTDLNAERVLAIVGTRKPTEYGLTQCEKIIDGLKDYGLLLVSGLAYGIDACVHRAGLKNGIPNIAVLGSGFGKLYPSSHRNLARELTECGGVMTEFFSQEGPDREHFPMRNRIIAAMSDALLVLESGEEGGSMISAGFAFEYNRDVLALPGRVTDEKSGGCNKLIASQKGALVRSAREIAEVMMWEERTPETPSQRSLFVELEPEERIVVDNLQSDHPLILDELLLKTKFTPGKLAAVLLKLEIKGLVKALPGKRYKCIQ